MGAQGSRPSMDETLDLLVDRVFGLGLGFRV